MNPIAIPPEELLAMAHDKLESLGRRYRTVEIEVVRENFSVPTWRLNEIPRSVRTRLIITFEND